MYNEGFEQWFKLNKNLSAPMNELNKATTEISKRISEQNLQLIEENVARISNQLKRLSSVKKPEDFLNLQRDCFSENMTASIETAQKIMHMAMENLEEISKVWGSTAAKITEKAVEKAQKYTEKAEKAER